ncbi:hypothetical protein ACLQ2R_17295 [Streptosporangium sp. DT93]|uniref:hypothetical protein n=1 Tax=Streptosporangium sp. DT93 TaxID=3393428 RepID=UPI003CF83A48
MSKQYQVIGALVTNVPIDTPNGATLGMFHQHAILPPGVPDDRIKHLLSVGLIKEVGGSAKTAEQPAAPDSGQTGEAKTVNARSSKAELVDHGVAQGGRRDELDALTLKELQTRYLKSSGQQQ